VRAQLPKKLFEGRFGITGTVLVSTAIHAHALACVFAWARLDGRKVDWRSRPQFVGCSLRDRRGFARR
jgi:hypothetical protein